MIVWELRQVVAFSRLLVESERFPEALTYRATEDGFPTHSASSATDTEFRSTIAQQKYVPLSHKRFASPDLAAVGAGSAFGFRMRITKVLGKLRLGSWLSAIQLLSLSRQEILSLVREPPPVETACRGSFPMTELFKSKWVRGWLKRLAKDKYM